MEEKTGHKKRRHGWKLVIVFLLFVLMGGIYYDTIYGKKILQTMVSKTIAAVAKPELAAEEAVMEMMPDSKTSFIAYGKGFLQCTKDGVKYFTDLATQKWNDTYTMSSPVAISEGSYAAVAEVLGREARVYGEKGLLYQVQTEGPIVQMALNQNGYLAIITNEKTKYKVIAYDNKGVDLTTRVDEPAGIFPIAVDISDDNRILAISYLDTTDMECVSKILFFYLNKEESKTHVDQLYASVEKKGVLAPVIAFSKDNKLFGVSDLGVFMADDTGKEIWASEGSNHLEEAAIGKNNFLVTASGEAFAGKEGAAVGTVQWYNQKGEVTASFEAKENVHYLKVWNDVTIVGAGKKYYALNMGGKIIWQYHAPEDVEDILCLENVNTVLYVTPTRAEIKNMAEEGEKKQKREEEQPAASNPEGEAAGKKEENPLQTEEEAPKEEGQNQENKET